MKTRILLTMTLLTLSVASVSLHALGTVSPSSLTFNTVVNGTTNPPSQQLTLTSPTGPFTDPSWTAMVMVNTPSGTSWLSIDNTSGPMNGVINVSVFPAGLPQGSWTGSVTIQFGQEPQIIVPITLNVAGTMTFNTSVGVNPPSQALALSVSSSGTFTATWTATMSTSDGGNWLGASTATATSSGNPATLSGSASSMNVNINVQGLAIGTYTGTISMTNVTSPLTTQVTLVITAPVLTVAPTSLTFNGTFAGTAPQPQVVAVTAGNAWTASAGTVTGGNWLLVSPASGNGNGAFNASVSLGGLGTGSYQGSITVAVGSSTPVVISVTLNVAGPTVSASPATLTFSQVQGSSALPQSVQLAATPVVTTWTATTGSFNSNVNWLSATPSAGAFPATVLVFPNAASATLQPGIYQGAVTISDANASPTTAMITVNVVLTVTASTAASKLSVGPSVLTPQTLQGVNPASAGISIGNAGSGTIAWSATASTINGGNWLSVSPGTGSASLSNASAAQVTFNAANLKAGIYTGQISVTSGTLAPQVVNVLLTVAPSGPLLVLGQTGLYLNSFAGVATTIPASVTVANPGAASEFVYTNVLAGTPWLTVTSGNPFPVSSGGTTNLNFAVNTNNLNTGVYYGLVQVTQGGTATTLPAQYVSVVLNVTGQAATSVYPVGIILTPAQLQSSFQVFTDTGGNTTVTLTPRALSGGNWLNAGPSSLTLSPTASSATVNVNVIAGSAPTTPGVYQGVVTASFSNGAPSQDISVLLVIPSTSGAQTQSIRSAAGAGCTPAQLIMAVRALGSNFTSTVGWPVNLEAQVVDNCANPVTGATVLATFSTGDAPLALGSLGSGVYSATWTPTNANPATVTIQALAPPLASATTAVPGSVAANAAPPPVIPNGGVVNAASFAPNADLTPGGIVSVFGSNLANSNGNSNSGFPLPLTLGGIKLSMGGADMPLFYSGTGQVNAQVPSELQPNSTAAIVARAINGTKEVDGVPVRVTVGPAHPGIFIAAETGAPNQGAILNASSQAVDAAHPASVGDVIVIYCTGLGTTVPFVATGTAAPGSTTLNVPVTVSIGGIPATAVAYAGLAPGYVGLYQINVNIPTGVTVSSLVPVIITQNGIASNSVTIAMH